MAKTIKELSEQIELLEKRIETIEKQYRTMFDIVQALNDKVDDIDSDLDDEQTYRIEMRENFDNCIDCISEHVVDLLNNNEQVNERIDVVDKTIKETQNNMVEIVGHIIREQTTLNKAISKLIHQVETIRIICSI